MKTPSLVLVGALLAAGLVTALERLNPASSPAAVRRIDFTRNTPAPGRFPDKWIHGSESSMDNRDPAVQVCWYNEHTVILRQNKAYEVQAPFLYLYFGNDRAILFDQGSVSNPAFLPMRDVV